MESNTKTCPDGRKMVSVMAFGIRIPANVALNDEEIKELQTTGDLEKILERRTPLEKAHIHEQYEYESEFPPQTHIITYDSTQIREYYKYLNSYQSRSDWENHYDKIYRRMAENGTELFSLGGYMPYKPYKKYAGYWNNDPHIELVELNTALTKAKLLINNLAIVAIGDWNVRGMLHVSNHRIIITPLSLEKQCLEMVNNPNISREDLNELKRYFDYHAEGTYYKGGLDFYFDGNLVNGTKDKGLILEKKYSLWADKR